MKPCIGIFMAIFLFGALSLTTPRAESSSAQLNDEIAALVMTSCSKCHDTKRICKNIGEKNREEWDKTVTRMIEKGALLPLEKKDQAIEYFLSASPGSKPICE
jgi:hypothetical protein